MQYLISLLSLLLLPIPSLMAQNDIESDSVMNRLLIQSNLFAQENIYAQTDKSDYVAGDTLWFRTYLVDAVSRKPTNLSHYSYAELINEQENIVIHRVKIHRNGNDIMHGYIPIPPSAKKGTYRFRAYTRYGGNWGENGLYSKPVRIYASSSAEINKDKAGKSDYQVHFLPEGGYAIHKQLSRFAFKAQSKMGNGEYIQGIVLDDKGDTITQFITQHNGMGELSFVPLAERKYYALCTNNKNITKKFVLPQAVHNAATLQITTNSTQCNVTLLHDSLFNTESLRLVILQRGYPCYISHWGEKKYMVFAKQNFDTGVVHFILLATNGKIVSERLVFINHLDNEKTLSLSTDCTRFIPRHLVNVDIEIKDSLASTYEGNCSVAITNASDIPIDRSTNIFSRLLLTADLNGIIENPGWYFEGSYSKEKEKAMDLVMMTHGWKRYDLQAAINGSYSLPSTQPETSMEISGTVKSQSGKPMDKADVQIYIQKIRWMQNLKTNRDGRFSCSGFNLPDSIKYLITAISAKNSKNIVLNIDTIAYPNITPYPDSYFKSNTSISDSIFINEEDYIQKTIRNLGYDHGMKHYLLNEVKISAKPTKTYHTEFERDANITITEERIKQSPGLLNLDMILKGIAGFYHHPTPNQSTRLVMDGVAVYDSIYIEQLLKSFNVGDIGQIDIIKGSRSAAYFDSKQTHIIAITTKRGGKEHNRKYVDTNMGTYTLIGYQQPVEMYTPRYDHPSANSDRPDLRTTISWKPDIKIKEGKGHFSFYTADSPAIYQVVAEGVCSNGKIFRKEERLFLTP